MRSRSIAGTTLVCIVLLVAEGVAASPGPPLRPSGEGIFDLGLVDEGGAAPKRSPSLRRSYADHPSDGQRDPLVVAQDIFADPALVVAAELASDGVTATDHAGVMSYGGPLAGFPRLGSAFGMVANGDTNLANDPNASQSTSTDLVGAQTAQGADIAGLTITFNVPAFASPCLIVDVKMLSEEFPEFVGSQFTDTVVARIGDPTAPTVDAAGVVSAPGSFLLGIDGGLLGIDNAVASAKDAAGTTYDGATPAMVAQAPIAPGTPQTTVSFWTIDVGDSMFDTNLFLDHLRLVDSADCAPATFGPTIIAGFLRVAKRKIVVKGIVLPEVPGQKVIVRLFKKDKRWKQVARKRARLNAASIFRVKLPHPDAKRCAVLIRYPGDGRHEPALAGGRFPC